MIILQCFQIEERIEQSVTRMMTVIDLARNIRERHNKPLKAPLKYAFKLSIIANCPLFCCLISVFIYNFREMVVVHPDAGFLEDITGKLKEVKV